MQALKPSVNVTVSASAGTGKTYLLVSRLLRLLLEDTSPGSIVAITFTRKAAGEMYERLSDRLYELASIDDQSLQKKLTDLGLDATYSKHARNLYEALLLHPDTVKITTFHAFCHDLLQRFPLEAGINPGFELLESSTLLKHQAWQQLLDYVTHSADSELNAALDRLFDECSNPNSVEELLLNDFLEHRSDWWAFTENAADPVAYAQKKTQQLLELDDQSNDKESLPNAIQNDLNEFASLLNKHSTKTNAKFAQTLQTLLERSSFDMAAIETFHSIFFTDKGTLRKREYSKAQAKSMGDSAEQRFLDLHQSLAQDIDHFLDLQKRQHTASISHAWYTVGDKLLSLFQQAKHEQSALDFSDLEWQVYKLLSDSEQSSWVQYKLDQRIDHILIDEFQDTNPTQWHMLHPLLEEITDQPDKQRSLFIVGDGKQSIYRFRRAAPDLFIASQAWLQQRPSNHYELRLDQSRRSSHAIINLVNHIFSDTNLGNKLIGFQAHDTVHKGLWGHTELLPLISNEADSGEIEDKPSTSELRNPLEAPREIKPDNRYQREGEQIVQKIHDLITNETPITINQHTRPIHYGDILILVKKRRHVADYENALLAAGIPFVGTQRKSLLSTLEIQDMLNLCNTLLTPHSNLALAVVLRSPIFSCTDEDLMSLALASNDHGISWYARLSLLAETHKLSVSLARAHTLLNQWHELVGTLPVHDLLDHIYHQGQIIARYVSAFPSHYVARVRANLTRFIELALEIDSGRYPSLQKFIYHLELLEQRNESPDEAANTGDNHTVRILTIHSAKGLEAPVVFIADTTNQTSRHHRHHALIDWPADAKQPRYFFLSSMHRDSVSTKLIKSEQDKDAIEDANLLYVALTRARQLLFISGVEPRQGDWHNSWYGQIARQVTDNFDPTIGWKTQYGELSEIKKTTTSEQPQSDANHIKQKKYDVIPFFPAQEQTTVTDKSEIDPEAAAYGDTIHHLLDLLSSQRLSTTQTAIEAQHALRKLSESVDFNACWRDALAVFLEPELQACFNSAHYNKAFNEVNVNAIDTEGKARFGIIDRLVVTDDEAFIIDYKSRQNLSGDLTKIAEEYREQLSRYRDAVKQLWPEKTARAAILFTAQRRLVELDF